MAQPTSADIIIVGAGAAGLALADELSKNSSLRVHILEAGKDCTGHPDTQNVYNYEANFASDRDWQYVTVPQAGLNGRITTHNAGKLIGGSSSINGGYYVAPSCAGITAWTRLGNTTWSYEALEQACLKTVQCHGPDQALRHSLGLDESPHTASAGSGPVQVAAELGDHPVTKAYFQALRDLGYPTTSGTFNNHSAIGQAIHLTQDPSTKIRSDANTAFGPALKRRTNVTISPDTLVKRIILEGTPPHVVAKGVEYVTGSGQTGILLAAREVVLSAGALSTPKLLELSGVGRPDLLQMHQIPVVISNPYVGERLRNHVMSAVHCELDGDVPPTTPGIKAMAYMTTEHQPGLTDILRSHVSQPGDDVTYDNEVKRIFLDPQEGSCYHFMGFFGVPNAYTFGIISAVPFSHGSSHISSPNVNEKPTIDPRFYTHPLDLEVTARHLKTAASFASQPALKTFFKMDENGNPVGAAPLTDPDLEKAKSYLREGSLSTYHACGTASMRPREDGGVVDEQLKVYDTANLRVVDASVIPLIPHGNPLATVYGIAHHAAGFIKGAAESE